MAGASLGYKAQTDPFFGGAGSSIGTMQKPDVLVQTSPWSLSRTLLHFPLCSAVFQADQGSSFVLGFL